MMNTVISGDIIASTSLNDTGRELLGTALKGLLTELNMRFDTYARIIRGDYLECVIPKPEDSLQVALAIKSFVKSITIGDYNTDQEDRRIKLFRTYGIRLAIGYGQLSRYNPEEGIIDGEAIYLSGRTIHEYSTYNKERIVIKNTLYFISNDQRLNRTMEPLMALLDVLLGKATSRQCQVLYLKLMNNHEETIAEKLKIAQPVVNQHSTTVGWNAIEKTLKYYREIMKS